ncbi:MAG: hypothetical protein WC982_02515 [Advenella sp.]
MSDEQNDSGKTGGFMSRYGGLPVIILFGLICGGIGYLVTGVSLLFVMIPVGFVVGIFLIQQLLSFCFRQEIKYEELKEKLMQTGLKITGEIVSVSQTGKYYNEIPFFSLKLKYFVGDQECIKQEVRILVPFTDLDLYKPGKNVELLVDPDNTQNVVLA